MSGPLHLFDAFGIELEYMLIGGDSLDVCSAVDEVLSAASGRSGVSEFIDGPITWSNELVLHVVELKVSEPAFSLEGLELLFDRSVCRLNKMASARGMKLMPTAMHPWMDPQTETRLWPHEYADVYNAYHRIFNCYRHGWANLQSVHLNLPFHGDEEFGRLHAAIRLVLPLLPALAASSPVMEGRVTGHHDSRLDVYINNSRLVDEVAGRVIPEAVFTEAGYRKKIFAPMMEAIRPHDAEGILEEDFLNSRGAIARFDRGAIEIRLIDVQECPAADLAVVNAVVHALRSLTVERNCALDTQMAFDTEELRSILDETTRSGEHAVISNSAFLSIWGITGRASCTARDIWQKILEDYSGVSPSADAALECVMSQGTLADRMLKKLGREPDRAALAALYNELADCLAQGRSLS